MAKNRELFISAGEISGDLHGGNLLATLKERIPGLSAFGIGGKNLESAGLEKIADIGDLSLVGITEVLPRLFSILALLSRIKKALSERRPRAVILIDSPDFNLRLARYARSLGIPVIYYIGPTVWAWRQKRLKSIKQSVDLMLPVLPFEEEIYRKAGIETRFLGHPLLDLSVASARKSALRDEFKCPPKSEVIALLPGSRRQEVEKILPSLIGACHILSRRTHPPLFFFPAASDDLWKMVSERTASLSGATVVRGRAVDLLSMADAAVVTSGTATLEAALQSVPFLTVYRLSALSYAVGRLLVKTPWISLPNILLGKGAVRELIQHECTPDAIAAEVTRLLVDEEYPLHMKKQFATMKTLLGPPGSIGRIAEEIASEAGLNPSRSDS